MQCADCHFDVDVHGNGLLYGEPRAATTIECIDCHGTITKRPTLITSGNGGIWTGTNIANVDLRANNTAYGPRFFWQGNKLFQRSSMAPDLVWEVPQTMDTVDPQSSHYNAKSAYAKTLRRDGKTWGAVPLTLALSPGERGQLLCAFRSSIGFRAEYSRGFAKGRGAILPLPGGEGRSEGDAGHVAPSFSIAPQRFCVGGFGIVMR